MGKNSRYSIDILITPEVNMVYLIQKENIDKVNIP